MNKKLLLLPVIVALLWSLAGPLFATPPDTIPQIDYIGYRLYLTHFEVLKEKKGQLYVQLSAINTGNKKMMMGKGAAQVFPVATFDPSLGTAQLENYRAAIYFQLLEEKLTIPIGAITTKIELKLPLYQEPVEEALVFNTDVGEGNPTNLPDEESLEVILEPAEVPATPIEVVEISEPLEPSEVDATTATSETMESTSETEALATTTTPTETKPTELEETIPTESVETTPAIETETTKTTAVVPADSEVADSEAGTCSDLIFQQVEILKRSKNSVTLQYQVYNQGLGKATLIVGKKKNQQSLAIRAHLSSSEKLTRGAIVLGGSFLHGDEVELAGGESYTGTLKLALHKLTKFTPYLILELDAYEFINECDERNNLSKLRLLEEQ